MRERKKERKRQRRGINHTYGDVGERKRERGLSICFHSPSLLSLSLRDRVRRWGKRESSERKYREKVERDKRERESGEQREGRECTRSHASTT